MELISSSWISSFSLFINVVSKLSNNLFASIFLSSLIKTLILLKYPIASYNLWSKFRYEFQNVARGLFKGIR